MTGRLDTTVDHVHRDTLETAPETAAEEIDRDVTPNPASQVFGAKILAMVTGVTLAHLDTQVCITFQIII